MWVVVSVVVRREVLSTDSVEAVVTTLGAKEIVVDKTVGIKTGVEVGETLVGTINEDVLPCGINVVFGEEKYVVLLADLNVEVVRGVGLGLVVGADVE